MELNYSFNYLDLSGIELSKCLKSYVSKIQSKKKNILGTRRINKIINVNGIVL